MELKSLLDLSQIVLILLELSLLVWYMYEANKKPMEKRSTSKRKISLWSVVISCSLITLLYTVDFVVFGGVFHLILAALWGACIFVWSKTLLRLNDIIRAEKELLRLQDELAKVKRDFFKSVIN